MRFTILITLCIGFITYGCNSLKASKTCIPPSGRFVNSTVLDKCPESMPADVPHFCLELNFRTPGKVDVDNGFEKFSLPYDTTEEGCLYKIAGATLFGDMFFIVDSDTSIRLIDTAWTKVKTFSSFKRTVNTENDSWNFQHLLNKCIIAGEYGLFKDGKRMDGKVTILSNGQMNGFKPYLGYTLCYAGDCLEDPETPARTIDLIDNQGGKTTFVFKLIGNKTTIELYSLADPIPDIKGERPIGPKVWELRVE